MILQKDKSIEMIKSKAAMAARAAKRHEGEWLQPGTLASESGVAVEEIQPVLRAMVESGMTVRGFMACCPVCGKAEKHVYGSPRSSDEDGVPKSTVCEKCKDKGPAQKRYFEVYRIEEKGKNGQRPANTGNGAITAVH